MYSFIVTLFGISSKSVISVMASCNNARSDFEILSISQLAAIFRMIVFTLSLFLIVLL